MQSNPQKAGPLAGGFRATGRPFDRLDAAVQPVVCTWIRTNSCQGGFKREWQLLFSFRNVLRLRGSLEDPEKHSQAWEVGPVTATSAASLLITLNAIVNTTAAL